MQGMDSSMGRTRVGHVVPSGPEALVAPARMDGASARRGGSTCEANQAAAERHRSRPDDAVAEATSSVGGASFGSVLESSRSSGCPIPEGGWTSPDGKPLRRVLFFGKNMSRSRCTGGLVDALERNGMQVKWLNMATLRRWHGKARSVRRAHRVFESYQPDIVFVFCRDLPLALLQEFRRDAKCVLWVEEALDDLDRPMAEYMRHSDLVCLSNPAHMGWLREQGVGSMAWVMSGFSPRFHYPIDVGSPQRDLVFIGGPGRDGQRVPFLVDLSKRYDTEIFGVGLHWERFVARHPELRVSKPVDNAGFRRVVATSRIVIGLNQVNSDPLYFSNRTFLTLACGGFHLTHYVPGLEHVFRNHEHLVWYHNREDCERQIDSYLRDEDARRRIASSGLEFVRSEHQYFHRVGRILDILQSGDPARGEPPVVLRPHRAIPESSYPATAGGQRKRKG